MKRPAIQISLLAVAIGIALSVLISPRSVAEQAKADADKKTSSFLGLWVSGRGSTLEIESINSQSGELRGWFRSATGTDDNPEARPVVGFVNFAEKFPGAASYGLPISLTVSWGPYGSISSWTGLILKTDSRTTIETQWLHARGSTQFEWDHTLTGSDTFIRPPPM